jgi:hypothetical protein
MIDDLFDDGDQKRSERLKALWTICAPCSARELTKRAIDAGLWEDDDVLALRIKAHLPEVRAFLDWVSPITGIQNGYKTADGTRKPIQLMLFPDHEFDITSDCKQANADRERIRQKIRVCLSQHHQRPAVPDWIWGPDDDSAWNQQAA